MTFFLGLRSHIYPAPDLAASVAEFTALLGVEPYFNEPFYVGYDIGGYELGLDPNAPVDRGPVTYWGVANADAAVAELVAAGAEIVDSVAEPGDGIRIGCVRLAATNALFGVIENPVFALKQVASDGPGR
jgi:hypothetical protein